MSTLSYFELVEKVFNQEITALSLIKSQLNASEINKSLQLLIECQGKIIVCGIGKSAHIANKMVATFNSTGSKSQFLHASEAIHGDLGMVDAADVVIILSKSGNTPEIKDVIPPLKNLSKAIIAIVSNDQSTLAKLADAVLHIPIDSEAGPYGLAPTTSTTAQLLFGDALAIALKTVKQFKDTDFAKFHPGGALGKQLLLRLDDLVDKDHKPTVEQNTQLKDVVIALASSKMGIAVVTHQNQVVGVITDGDLRRTLTHQFDAIKDLSAQDIMTSNPKTIDKSTMAKDALQLMRLYAINQLVVMDQGQYYGLIDLHTLLKEGLE